MNETSDCLLLTSLLVRLCLLKNIFRGLIFLSLAPYAMAQQSLNPEQVQSIQLKAESYFQEGNFIEAARHYNQLAFHYWELQENSRAIEFFQQSARCNEKTGNINALKHIYNNIGQIYLDEYNFAQCERFLGKSLEISRAQKRKPEIASTLINMAAARSEANNYTGAIQLLDEALSLALELQDLNLQRRAYAMLAQNYSMQGDPERASAYFEFYASLERHLQQQQMQRMREEAGERVSQAEMLARQAEEEKKHKEQELNLQGDVLRSTRQTLEEAELVSRERQLQIDLLDKESKLHLALLQQKQTQQNILLLGVAALVVVSLLIYYSAYQKKQANRKLAAQNREIAGQRDQIGQQNQRLQTAFEQIKKQNDKINDSIAYAERIQNALLPSEEAFSQLFRDAFILFKPRDVVSGDFYWFAQDQNQDIMVAAIDCTGHGVPGAFMSMIGLNLLENITREEHLEPHQILENLHAGIRNNLKQLTNENRDGMEMALIKIQDQGRTLTYSGARNPLYYSKKDKIEQIKADPTPIGGLQIEAQRRFSSSQLQIQEPTCIYLFSDGFADQFGGEQGNKYSSRRLRSILQKIHKRPMSEQKAVLEAELEQWMGNKHKQLDDILIIGLRLSPPAQA